MAGAAGVSCPGVSCPVRTIFGLLLVLVWEAAATELQIAAMCVPSLCYLADDIRRLWLQKSGRMYGSHLNLDASRFRVIVGECGLFFSLHE